MAKSRLMESLKSLSGKLTLSPEIVVVEPTDATALLLQSSAVQTLSGRLGQANAAFLKGSTAVIQTFLTEQELARGSFPGPLPVIYCGSDKDEDGSNFDISELEGISGVLITTRNVEDGDFVSKCQAVLKAGVQPVPEVMLGSGDQLDESTVPTLVDSLVSVLGQDPAGVLISVEASSEENEQETTLPPVPKALAKKLPILASLKTPAGDNRMGAAVQEYKELGYTGAVLRSACLPPGLELEVVGRFWSNCLSELKSTRSKTFEVHSRNAMDKSTPLEWAKYQKSIMDSGALGSAEDNAPIELGNGAYKGF